MWNQSGVRADYAWQCRGVLVVGWRWRRWRLSKGFLLKLKNNRWQEAHLLLTLSRKSEVHLVPWTVLMCPMHSLLPNSDDDNFCLYLDAFACWAEAPASSVEQQWQTFPLPQQSYNHSARLVVQGISGHCLLHVWFCMFDIHCAYSSQLAWFAVQSL